MLKDIYSLGIAILELMIGRTSKQTFSISLDSLPLTWAEFPESTPLIQVLVECIQNFTMPRSNHFYQQRWTKIKLLQSNGIFRRRKLRRRRPEDEVQMQALRAAKTKPQLSLPAFDAAKHWYFCSPRYQRVHFS